MRWDEQRTENDLRLPGVGDGTVVRTFDAPEAMGINFHEVRARSALNHVPGGRYGFSYTVNPFRGCTHACVFCFARSSHTYLDFNAGRDFEREIVVKVNVPEVLRAELARPSWKRDLVALGTNTDPYQWVESRYRFMPEILAALEEADTPVSVLTKSPLALRDIDLYERMSKRLPVSVNLSVPTLDEKAWRTTEPHTPSPSARLDAVAELRSRGIDSGVLIAPLMPGINDDPEQVQPIVDRARRSKRHLPWRRSSPPTRRGPRRLLRLAGGKTPGPASPLRAALRGWPRQHAPRSTQASDPSRSRLGKRSCGAGGAGLPSGRADTQRRPPLTSVATGSPRRWSPACRTRRPAVALLVAPRPAGRTCTPRVFVVSEAAEACAVANASRGRVVVAHFDHQLRPQRDPLEVAAAGPATRLGGAAVARLQRRQHLGHRRVWLRR